jgi:O-antigen/teichoic acid export membrane protein
MLVLRIVLSRKLPPTTEKPVFNFGLIASLRKFTLGMSGISLISILVYEADKLSVAKLTTLALLGIYTTTSSVASSLSRFSSPLGQSFYPRMVQEVQKNNTVELAKLFNKASQLMAVLVTPVTCFIFFFSKELLLIWTKNVEFSAIGADLLKIFIIGNLAVTFNGIPYILQLSYGYTKLTLYQNIFLLVVLVPALLFVVPKYGVLGAALIWMSSNVLVFCISSFIMFKRYLTTDRNYWYTNFIIKPILISILCLFGCRYLFDILHIEGTIANLGYFAISLLLSFIVLVLSYSTYRNAFIKLIGKFGRDSKLIE